MERDRSPFDFLRSMIRVRPVIQCQHPTNATQHAAFTGCGVASNPLVSVGIAGHHLDELGLAAGAGLGVEAPQMRLDRGLGDAQHLRRLRHPSTSNPGRASSAALELRLSRPRASLLPAAPSQLRAVKSPNPHSRAASGAPGSGQRERKLAQFFDRRREPVAGS